MVGILMPPTPGGDPKSVCHFGGDQWIFERKFDISNGGVEFGKGSDIVGMSLIQLFKIVSSGIFNWENANRILFAGTPPFQNLSVLIATYRVIPALCSSDDM